MSVLGIDPVELLPQNFDENAQTVLPAFDFVQDALNTLPNVYRNAKNFSNVVILKAKAKQFIYDIIRSLLNIYNLNSSNCAPVSVYLRMLATDFGLDFGSADSDANIARALRNRILFVNSRGKFQDFINYFLANAIDLTKVVFELDGNATIKLTLPVTTTVTPPQTQSQYDKVLADLTLIKGGGVKLLFVPVDISYFSFAGANGESDPSTGGFASIDSQGRLIGGGYFIEQ